MPPGLLRAVLLTAACGLAAAWAPAGQRIAFAPRPLPACASRAPMRAALPARRAARPLLAAAAQPAEPGPGDAEGASARLKRKAELKKMLPLGLMFFFILFNYTILRDTKDVLVVTAPKSGAEIIPFLKTYVNLPGAIGFTVLYSKLTNKYSRTNVFYGIVATFLAFFSAFAFFIYPNQARTRRAPAAHPPPGRRV